MIVSLLRKNIIFSSFFILFSILGLQAQVTTLISQSLNNGGFEQGTTGWSFESNSGVNKWALGSVTTTGYSGANCAYISNSTSFPFAHQYTTTSNSISKIYRDVVFPAATSNYVLNFKTLVQGKASSAQLFVYLVNSTEVLNPNSLPTGTVLANYSLQGTGWVDKKINIDNTLLGNGSTDITKKLVFVWQNFNSTTGTQPPASIDDITLDNCSSPQNITAIPSYNQLTLNWESPDTSWIVRYKLATATSWTQVNAGSRPFVISGLIESTNYKVQIQNAGLACNDWSTEYTFTTTPQNSECINATLIEGQDDVNSLVYVVANFTGAGMSGPSPVCSYTFTNTAGNLWFRFTANAPKYILDANPYLKAELYSGTDCNNLVYQYCKAGLSYLDNLVVGSQYYLKLIDPTVDNIYANNQMNFRLVKCPDAPANDLCENATPFTGTVLQGQLVGDNNEHPTLAYNSFSSPTQVLGDVWFSFVATENYATIVAPPINIFPETGHTLFVDLYTGNCSSLTLAQSLGQFDTLSGGGSKDTSQLLIGQTYYVRIYNQNVTKSWPFTLNIIPRSSPVNDLCSSPTTITLDTDGETQFAVPTPTYATPSVGVPSTCTITSTKDVWYQFTAGATAYLISSTYMTNTYSGTCGSYTQLGCGSMYVAGNMTIGQVYTIRVYQGQTITIRELVAEDECSSSTVLIPAANPNFAYSSTINATAGSLPTSCIANNKDVWFQFTATSTKNKITLFNGYATTVAEALAITVYSGDCNNLVAMGCYSFLNNSLLDVVLSNYVVGQTYYIKATRASSTYFGIKVIPIATQPNDEMVNAIAITPDEQGVCTLVNGSTAGSEISASLPATCTGTTPYNDVWYSFVATVPSYKITLSTTGYHSITIYKSTGPGTISLFTCLTENITGFEVGTTYYIRIGSASQTYTQTFAFCISKIIDSPINDACSNPITVPVSPTMACSNSVTADLALATYNVTNPIVTPCTYGSLDKDVWYQFTATSTKILFNNTLSDANKSIRYAVLQANCTTFSCITGNSISSLDTDVISGLTVGTTYLLKISYVNDNQVSFCLSTPPTIANDLCQNATELIPASDLTCNAVRNYTHSDPSITLSVSGCTGTLPLYLYNSSSPTNYGDAWYKFTATNTEHVLTFTSGVGIVQLFEGSCAGFSCHNSFNYPSGNNTDYLFSQLVVGQTYYIRILHGNYGNSFSYYDICLKTPTSMPSNDEYSNAMVLVPSSDLDTCNPVSNLFNRATNSSSIQAPSCSNISNPKDVWFQFTATSTHHQLQIHLSNPQATVVSFFTSLYSSVGGVINQQVSCYDPFDNIIPNLDVSLGGTDYNTNYYYPLMLQNYYNLTVGATYYIRMYPYVDQPTYTYSILMPYDVCLKTLPDIPVNSDYPNAIPLTVSAYDNLQYVSGYSTRAAYHVTEPYNNVTNPCAELGAFAYPSYQASNVWYKFTAQQTSQALHVINDANVLFPMTDYLSYPYYTLYAALYESNSNVMETKQCYADTANNLVFSNLTIGKEYYLKMMYRQILYQTDFEFQLSVANVTALGNTNQEQKGVTIYPNPVQNILTIYNPNQEQLTSVKLYNMLGQLVLEQKTTTSSDQQVDMTYLQKGAYILKVKSDTGENSYSVLKE